MTTDSLGLVAALAVYLILLGVVFLSRRLDPRLRFLLAAGLLLRLVGAGARYGSLQELYDGQGDAVAYFNRSLAYADRVWALDLTWIWDSTAWIGTNWWGTQFVHVPAGFLIAAIGPTFFGTFAGFALLGYAGVVALVAGYHRENTDDSTIRYAAWCCLFPSLWFWPSSLGKEAIVLAGLGVTVWAYLQRRDLVRTWVLLGIGLFIVFAVRPQLAALLVVSLALAEWIGTVANRRLSLVNVVAIGAVGAATVWLAGRAIGIEDYDPTALGAYIETSATRRAVGNTAVAPVAVSVTQIPMAIGNILFRPFPWEATSPMVLVAGLEVWLFWGALFTFRRRAISTISQWRENRLVRVALVFSVLYAAALGMMVVNLGIVARQRVFLFPFLFVFLSGSLRQTIGGDSPTSVDRFPDETRTDVREVRPRPVTTA